MKHWALVNRIILIVAFYLSIALIVDFLFFHNNYRLLPFISSVFHSERPVIYAFFGSFLFSLFFFIIHAALTLRHKNSLKSGNINRQSDHFGVVETMFHAPIHHFFEDSLVTFNTETNIEKILSVIPSSVSDKQNDTESLGRANDVSERDSPEDKSNSDKQLDGGQKESPSIPDSETESGATSSSQQTSKRSHTKVSLLSDDDRTALVAFFQNPATTDLERDIFRLLYHYRAWPADIAGYHGKVTLLQHSLQVWLHACQKHGSGTDASIIAAAHDLGKLIAYRPKAKIPYTTDPSTEFSRISVRHVILNLVVLRRIPSFRSLDPDKRDAIITSLTILSKTPGVVPDIRQSETIAAARAAIASDVKITSKEVVVSENQAADSQDDDQFMESLLLVLNEKLIQQICKLNINRTKDSSGTPHGFSFSSSGYVVIQSRYVRLAMKDILPAAMVERLRLSVGASSPQHAATPTISAALVQGGFILPSFESVTPVNALFTFRSGRQMFRDCYLFQSDRFPESVIQNWGDWPMDVELQPL